MRIASYYPDERIVGRNDGGPLYHTHVLRRLFGEENVKHLMPGGDLSRMGKFDLNYWVDWGEDAFGLVDLDCPKPNIYVTSDTHLGYDYRLKMAAKFDHVFCNQRDAAEKFTEALGKKCHWLPHAFDPLAYNRGVFNLKKNDWDTEAVPLKKYDVSFVGNLNDRNRVEHLDALFKAVPNFHWATRRFHEAAEVYNASRTVFNVSARGEVNMRVFEALGAGALLVTDRIDDLDLLGLRDGHELVCYNGINDAIGKIRYYAAHQDEARKIADAGYRAVMERHTYAHRVLDVLEKVGIEYDKVAAAKLLPAVPVAT